MDEFFQKLREIQKKERSVSGLSRVGDDFYHQIFSYFNHLMKKIDNNPLSFESYLLRDAQRIVAEICERREHKISNSAVMNVQRSYLLFKDSNQDSLPNAPLNSTPEEETLYKELFQSLVKYRKHMRAPLTSYPPNKSQHLNQNIKPELTKSKPKKALKVIDTSSKVPKQVKDTERAESSKTRVNKIDNTNKVIKNNQDEVPPEIEAEIYREFGKEPSTKKKVSEEGIPEPLKGSGKEAKAVKGKISTELVMILDELPSIMGVDRKVYGPFYPGDVITMPEPNARILIKNQKGKSIQRYK
ncbi:MAG: DNA replication complex subunit Gins51 [Methanobacteriaceae archaeon]